DHIGCVDGEYVAHRTSGGLVYIPGLWSVAGLVENSVDLTGDPAFIDFYLVAWPSTAACLGQSVICRDIFHRGAGRSIFYIYRFYNDVPSITQVGFSFRWISGLAGLGDFMYLVYGLSRTEVAGAPLQLRMAAAATDAGRKSWKAEKWAMKKAPISQRL